MAVLQLFFEFLGSFCFDDGCTAQSSISVLLLMFVFVQVPKMLMFMLTTRPVRKDSKYDFYILTYLNLPPLATLKYSTSCLGVSWMQIQGWAKLQWPVAKMRFSMQILAWGFPKIFKRPGQEFAATLWRESGFEITIVKAPGSRTTFWGSKCFAWQGQGFRHSILIKIAKTYCSSEAKRWSTCHISGKSRRTASVSQLVG